MKILVVSDSHGTVWGMAETAEIVKPDAIFHLGDHFTDAKILKAPVIRTVRGNCDGYEIGEAPEEAVFELSGVKFFLTHGHTRSVKFGYDKLVYAALERKVNVALFGHTHTPELFAEDGVIFMNPGSIAVPRGTRPSYGIVDAEGKDLAVSVIFKHDNGVCKIWRREEIVL